VSLVRGSMLQACAPHSKWRRLCVTTALRRRESAAILTSARAAGLQLRVHRHQLEYTGGVALGSKWTPRRGSLHVLSDDDVDQTQCVKYGGYIAAGADFSTRATISSARRRATGGAVVALATDCNRARRT